MGNKGRRIEEKFGESREKRNNDKSRNEGALRRGSDG